MNRPTGQAARLARLEADAGTQGTGPYGARQCGGCGLYSYRVLPPGMLSLEEIEAQALEILGGELYASWPRCEACRRPLPPAKVTI